MMEAKKAPNLPIAANIFARKIEFGNLGRLVEKLHGKKVKSGNGIC